MKDKEKGYEGLVHSIHYYSNEIYHQWDENLKPKKKHMQHLLNACKDFIKLNQKMEKERKKQ